MFLEMLNDLFMSSSVFYICFGMLLLTVGVSQLFALHLHTWNTRANWPIKYEQSLMVDRLVHEQPLTMHEVFIIWFVKSLKAIERLDDVPNVSNSFYFLHLKISEGKIVLR